MNRLNLPVVVLILTCLLMAGCAGDSASPDSRDNIPHASLSALKEWVNSLAGLSIAQVKERLKSMEPKESSWGQKDEGGLLLSYEYPDCDVDLYCSDDRVVLVSIDLSPD